MPNEMYSIRHWWKGPIDPVEIERGELCSISTGPLSVLFTIVWFLYVFFLKFRLDSQNFPNTVQNTHYNTNFLFFLKI